MENLAPDGLARLSAQIATAVANAVKEAMATQAQPNPPPPEEDKSVKVARIIDSLSARLATFKHVPEEEGTFENWYVRYEKLIDEEGGILEAKARLILAKLDARGYALFANRLLPKVPDSLTFAELIAKLKETFKSTSSEFRRRYDFLQASYNRGALEEYTGNILRRFTTSKWKDDGRSGLLPDLDSLSARRFVRRHSNEGAAATGEQAGDDASGTGSEDQATSGNSRRLATRRGV
ncbi:unnamed protein product [Caenorhabditis sp. 36 PRJEB53466]|nr:unnamed protein product [Caenorhabditis sp. 36 PRJEB53466]